MNRFFVEPDISVARTLHKDFYQDPAVFAASKELLFADSWQYMGDSGLVEEPGSIYPLNFIEGYMDEPLMLLRNKEDLLRLLSNVCTHRGNILVENPCVSSNLRCRYHGRLFSLEGRFISMPEFREVKNFPTTADDLVSLPLFQWGKSLFASLKNGQPEIFFGEMKERLAWLPIEDFVFSPQLSKEFTVHAHWALYCENYLEGFHIPFVHAGLNAVIDFGNYTTELFGQSNLQLGIAKDEEDCFDLPSSSPDHGKKVAAYYFFVFPNLMFNFYPWGLSINQVKPVSQHETRISFLTYLWKPEKYNTGAGSGLDAVELEDEEVVELVQKGIRSRFYQQGRYSVTREQGIHHFHRLIAQRLEKLA
jgi:choline monooxygenase